MSVVSPVRSRTFLAMSSALVMVAGTLFGANVASADSVQMQSYQRASQTEACVAQPGETPWQASWGTNSSWSPTWERWANKGKGGWTCTRSITWARSPAAASGSSGGGGGSATYAVGDIGPGGGLVFLISGGKTYEMAPNAWGTAGAIDPSPAWCNVSTNVTTSTGTGTGTTNTAAMKAACTSGAANLATAYLGGGFTDWFLPSQDELMAMWAYQGSIVDTARYGFATDDLYWSSSQFDSNVAWYQRFDARVGSQAAGGKSTTLRVRPVRSF